MIIPSNREPYRTHNMCQNKHIVQPQFILCLLLEATWINSQLVSLQRAESRKSERLGHQLSAPPRVVVLIRLLFICSSTSLIRAAFASSPALQVPRLPHLQKHLGRSGFLRHRGNTGHQVQVSVRHERNLSSGPKKAKIRFILTAFPKPEVQFILLFTRTQATIYLSGPGKRSERNW